MFIKQASTLKNTITALFVLCALPMWAPQADAAAPAIVKSLNSAGKVSIQVPSNGKDAIYYFGANKVIVPAGTTAEVPVGAERIFLPKGTVVITTQGATRGGKDTRSAYATTEPVTLPGLSADAFKASLNSFVVVSYGDGYSAKSDYSAKGGKEVIASPAVQPKDNTLRDLIEQVDLISTKTVVPTNIKGDDVTDGNQTRERYPDKYGYVWVPNKSGGGNWRKWKYLPPHVQQQYPLTLRDRSYDRR